MCGIAGILAGVPIESDYIVAMNDTLRHRGPDDEGYFLASVDDHSCLGGPDTPAAVYAQETPYAPSGEFRVQAVADSYLALGHRRLSIVDLSPLGHQPMKYGDRYWIVYNGEVYNHHELRRELELAGYSFRSHSDTEIILASYDYWGADCLSRFNGMWAFALYDRQKQTLLLSRDRFGVKPLYYWISPAGFCAFASEIKAFTVLPGWNPRVNGQRVYDFLTWGVLDHTDETMFAGVFQLPGGCCVHLGTSEDARGQLAKLPGERLPGIVRWYELRGSAFSGSLADAADEFLHRFEDSVRLRLRADVPVGSCLSGGLDSSSIVCVANRFLRQQSAAEVQKTFSACARVKRFDERNFVDEVVGLTGVDAHYTYPEIDGLFSSLDAITWHQDEPFGSTSIYAQWSVFRLAAENGVKVMLDGQGADEQLAGYHGYFGPFLSHLFRRGNWRKLSSELRAIRGLHGYAYSQLGRMLGAYLFPALRLRAAALVGGAAHSAEWLDCGQLGIGPKDPFRALFGQFNDVSDLSRAQLTSTSVPMLLHWEDRDSMAHSIESRVPFLDYRLVEFTLGLPDEYKLSRGVTKIVQREGLRGILPEAVRMRMDKLGFVTPEEVWLRETGTEDFRSLLQQAVDCTGGVVKPAVMEILEKMVRGERRFDFFIWRLISFGAWVRCFGVAPSSR